MDFRFGKSHAAAGRKRAHPSHAASAREGRRDFVDIPSASSHAAPGRRLRIAMVSNNFGLLPWRSVRDNVALARVRVEPPATRKRIIDEQLELSGCPVAERTSASSPGGMQQRVAWRARLPRTRMFC